MTEPTEKISDIQLQALSAEPRPINSRRSFINPSSSFVDFAHLKTEHYTERGMIMAKDYDPYTHRRIKRPVSDLETCLHLLNGCIGAGLLSMPMAFQCSGTILGTAVTPFLSALCVYALHTLIQTQYIQCKRLQAPFLTLPRSMKIALLNGPQCLRCFAHCSPYFVDFMLISNQIGCCTAYVDFIASSVKQLLDPVFDVDLDKRIYISLLIVPLMFINYIRDLKKLTPVSIISNCLVFTALLCIFYFIFFEDEWKIDDTNFVSEVNMWPMFLGTVLFSLGAPGLVIALQYNMKKPQHFLGVAGIYPWSLLAVMIVYMAIGLLGYLKYGPITEGTIVSSLPQSHGLAKAVVGVYLISMYCTYPLQTYVSMEIIWGNYIVKHIKNPDKECFIEFILRTTTVVLTVVLALAIPNINVVVALVGVFCLSYLGLIYPFLIELCTVWYDHDMRYGLTFFKDLIFILLGSIILCIGTYTTLYEYIRK